MKFYKSYLQSHSRKNEHFPYHDCPILLNSGIPAYNEFPRIFPQRMRGKVVSHAVGGVRVTNPVRDGAHKVSLDV